MVADQIAKRGPKATIFRFTARFAGAISAQNVTGWFVRALVLALAYFAFAFLGLQFATIQGAGSPLWPAAGIGLAGLIIGGLNLWPAILFGRLLAGIATNSAQPFEAEVALAAAHAISSAIAVYVYRRQTIVLADLTSVATIFRFSTYAVGLFSLLVTSTGVLTLSISSDLATEAIIQVFIMGFLSVASGALIGTPLILNWWYGAPLTKPVYFWLLMGFIGVCAALFLSVADETPLRVWHLLPLLLWASLVFQMRGAVTALAVVATLALVGAIWNRPFVDFGAETVFVRITLIQQFIVIAAVTFLFVAALQSDRVRDSERFLRRVLDGLYSFVTVLTPKGTLVEANMAPLISARIDPANLIGRPYDQCVWWVGDSKRQEDLRKAIGRAAAGETLRYDVAINSTNEDEQWLDFQIAPLRDKDGAITHLIASGVDITARRQAEGRLRELAEIIEETPDLVATADLKGNITFMNAGGKGLINNVEVTKFEDQSYNISQFVGSQFSNIITSQAIPAALKNGYWRGETTLRQKTGNDLAVSQVILLHRDEAGNPSRISTIARDVTREKADAEHRSFLMRELLHRVRNTLAIIQSIARQTARSTPDPKKFAEVFIGRVDAMAAAHTLLTDTNWYAPNIRAVIKSQLGGFTANSAQSLVLEGEDIALPPEVSTKFGLVLHELGTNAQKYGSWASSWASPLTGDAGHVKMSWKLENSIIHVVWREHLPSGAKIQDTAGDHTELRRGFGSTLIERSVTNYQKVTHGNGLEIRFSVLMHE